jgi:hypothetical protein
MTFLIFLCGVSAGFIFASLFSVNSYEKGFEDGRKAYLWSSNK